jgi:GNAT superfamily N-acetyltransferase
VTSVDALLAVQKAASLAGFAHIFPPDLYPFPDDAVRLQLVAQLGDPGVEVLPEETDGRLVGFALVQHEELHRLYVVPEAWGTGVAARLHDVAVARWRELGIENAVLWVLEENRRARRFYERRGWSETGERVPTPSPPHPVKLRYRLELS